MLELSRKCATIDTAVRLTWNAEQLSADRQALPRLRELYTRLELRLLLRSLDASPEAIAAAGAAAGTQQDADGSLGVSPALKLPDATVAPVRRRAYDIVTTRDALDAWLAQLAPAPVIPVDTEPQRLHCRPCRTLRGVLSSS